MRGQHLELLNGRRLSGGDLLVLRRPSGGTMSIPREWTDKADPSFCDAVGRPLGHDFACLLSLVDLIKSIREASEEADRRDVLFSGDHGSKTERIRSDRSRQTSNMTIRGRNL